MITGFNTDVEFQGRVFHVQTEDKGLANPVVESLVYSGGEIVTSRRSPYSELIASGHYSPEGVQRMVEAQHNALIEEIRGGSFGAEDPLPFGHSIVTNRSLDEVVEAFLLESVPMERIKLGVRGPKHLHEGSHVTLVLRVLERNTERPICGASVSVDLMSEDEPPRELARATTDERGAAETEFYLPPVAGAAASVQCRAEAAGLKTSLKRQVRPRKEASAD